MSEMIAWFAVLWVAGGVAYLTTITDGALRSGRGGEGDRREADRQGRNNEPRTEGPASGDFYERFN